VCAQLVHFRQGVQVYAPAVVPTTVIRVTRQVRALPALPDPLHLVGALRRVGQHVPHAPWAVGAMVQATRVCVYLAHTPEAGPRSALCAEPIIGMLGVRVQELVLHVQPGRSRRETT